MRQCRLHVHVVPPTFAGKQTEQRGVSRFYSVLQVDDHTYHAIMGSRILRRDATSQFWNTFEWNIWNWNKKNLNLNLLFFLGSSTRYFYFYFYLCAVYVLQHTDIHVCCRYMYTTCVWYRRYTGISPPVCCTSRRYVSCSKNIPLFHSKPKFISTTS